MGCLRQYGHHVVDAILKNGSDEQKHKVFEILNIDLMKYAIDSYGWYVIGTALAYCTDEDQAAILLGLSDFRQDTNERLWGLMQKADKKLKGNEGCIYETPDDFPGGPAGKKQEPA